MKITQTPVEVGMNTYKRVDGLGEITSGWLDPCIAVAFYQLGGNTCYLAHLQNVHDPVLTEVLTAVLQEFHNPKDTQIFVCGGHIWARDLENQITHIEGRRNYVLQVLRENGFDLRQIKIQWGKVNHISKLTIDTSDMRLEYIEKEQER